MLANLQEEQRRIDEGVITELALSLINDENQKSFKEEDIKGSPKKISGTIMNDGEMSPNSSIQSRKLNSSSLRQNDIEDQLYQEWIEKQAEEEKWMAGIIQKNLQQDQMQ